eukprot:1391765-Alexandrium_andersonii.AAC.1
MDLRAKPEYLPKFNNSSPKHDEIPRHSTQFTGNPPKRQHKVDLSNTDTLNRGMLNASDRRACTRELEQRAPCSS